MKRLLTITAAVLLAGAGQAGASDSFQFAPPPWNILNIRSVDVQRNMGFDYIGQKVGDFKFHAGNFGGSRAVKKWESGGMSVGGNIMLLLGDGSIPIGSSRSDIMMFGEGFGGQFNFYFDMYGDEEDNTSLPFYFGPHVNMNMLMGSVDYSYYIGSTKYTNSIFMTVTTIMYGWQAGVQAGLNLTDSVKFIPYVDFSQELGGSVATSMSSSGYSSSTSQSVKSMPVAMTPGFDFMFRKAGLSLGGAFQNSKSASKKDVKTTMFHLRWQKKFHSICGI